MRALTIHSKNKGILLFLIVFVVGYVFFFTSNFWMPVGGDAKRLSDFNREIEFNGRKVSLIRWEYSPVEHRMEVELDILNTTFDGIDTYSYSAIDSHEGRIEVLPVVEDPDFVVLQLNQLPKRWSEVSLRVEMPQEYEDIENASTLRLYTNANDVAKVNTLRVKSKNEYLAQRMDTMIAYYESEIVRIQGEIEKQGEYQENCEAEIQRLIGNKKYQTTEEIEETDRLITAAEQKMESSKDTVTRNYEEIKEYEEQIGNANDKKALYLEKE